MWLLIKKLKNRIYVYTMKKIMIEFKNINDNYNFIPTEFIGFLILIIKTF